MKFVFLLIVGVSALFANASSAAQETSNTQANVKSVISTQTTVSKNIRSLYVEDIVDTKKIVFNSEVEIKIKTEEKR